MKLKKLLIGVFLITAVVCGSVEVSRFSEAFSSSPAACVVVSHSRKESISTAELPPREKTAETELRYNFTVKISHRFNSSPPRASPLI